MTKSVKDKSKTCSNCVQTTCLGVSRSICQYSPHLRCPVSCHGEPLVQMLSPLIHYDVVPWLPLCLCAQSGVTAVVSAAAAAAVVVSAVWAVLSAADSTPPQSRQCLDSVQDTNDKYIGLGILMLIAYI